MRLAQPPGDRQRERRSAAGLRGAAEYQGRIRVADIPNGPLCIAPRWRLGEPILRGDWAVFGPPAAWAPPAMSETPRNREVQRRAIDAGLAARDNR